MWWFSFTGAGGLSLVRGKKAPSTIAGPSTTSIPGVTHHPFIQTICSIIQTLRSTIPIYSIFITLVTLKGCILILFIQVYHLYSSLSRPHLSTLHYPGPIYLLIIQVSFVQSLLSGSQLCSLHYPSLIYPIFIIQIHLVSLYYLSPIYPVFIIQAPFI